MAESSLNITYIPTAKPSGEELEKRLGTKHLYLPLSAASLSAEKSGVFTPSWVQSLL